jgi:hypothetical protein
MPRSQTNRKQAAALKIERREKFVCRQAFASDADEFRFSTDVLKLESGII